MSNILTTATALASATETIAKKFPDFQENVFRKNDERLLTIKLELQKDPHMCDLNKIRILREESEQAMIGILSLIADKIKKEC